MSSVGVLGWIAGLLQLSVPSYALHLVRRFGTHRVGWFVVTAFASLALLHALGPFKPAAVGSASVLILEGVYAVGSVLLLIGMGHMETLFSERERSRRMEDNLRREWEAQAQEGTAHLSKSNAQLRQEIARQEEIVKSLEASEEQYRLLFLENPQPMWILDLRSCRFLAANSAALQLYGFAVEEFMALTGRDLMLPATVADYLRELARPCPAVESRGVWQHCKKDGTLIEVEITAVDLDYGGMPARLVVANDITQRRRRELELRKAHKMEVIGQVAGGVSHYFNHFLAVIEGHASTLATRPLDQRSAEEVGHIATAVARADELTRELLTAGGRQLIHPEPLDLNELIRRAYMKLSQLAGERIVVEFDCPSYVPLIVADRQLVEQILVNLVLNARDAMPQGGHLTLSTARVVLDEQQVETGHPGRSGEFVRLTIHDTGCGMTAQVQSRLFEPFFTTRDSSTNKGLGLATVFGAVKQQSGWIDYATEVGVGTEFKVFLPAAPASLARKDTQTAVRKGTILLVEPDDRARALARYVLNRQNYRVIETDNSATALILWAGQSASVDVLITDVVLPGGMSGTDLARELSENKPGLKIIFTAELAAESSIPDKEQLAGRRCLPKPCHPDTLVEAVRGCLLA